MPSFLRGSGRWTQFLMLVYKPTFPWALFSAPQKSLGLQKLIILIYLVIVLGPCFSPSCDPQTPTWTTLGLSCIVTPALSPVPLGNIKLMHRASEWKLNWCLMIVTPFLNKCFLGTSHAQIDVGVTEQKIFLFCLLKSDLNQTSQVKPNIRLV